MKSKDKTYNQLLERLKKISPVMDNPTEVTDEIMMQIKKLPPRRKSSKLIFITGWVSGIAAMLLFCLLVKDLFFFQTFHSAKIENIKEPTFSIYDHELTSKSSELVEDWKPGMKMTEKSQILFYIIQTKQQEKKRKREIEANYKNIYIK